MTDSLEIPRRRAASIDVVAASAALVVGIAAGVVASLGPPAIAVGAVLGPLLAAAGLPDLRERRIPNRVVAAAAVAASAIGVVVAVSGDRPVIGSMAAGASCAAGPLFAGHLVRPSGIGFGDVKLAAVIGALLGVVHWVLGAVMLGVASMVGLIGAGVVRAWRRSIPFGVCLAVASLFVLAGASWLRTTWRLW